MSWKCGCWFAALFFPIKSIFEVYNEGARETILIQWKRSNEKQKKNSKEVSIVQGTIRRTASAAWAALQQTSLIALVPLHDTE